MAKGMRRVEKKGAVTAQARSATPATGKAGMSTSVTTVKKVRTVSSRGSVARSAVKKQLPLSGFVTFGSPKATETGVIAIERLVGTAARSDDAGEFVATLLDVAASVAEKHRAPGAMSAADRAVWESVGARFDDAEVVARVESRGMVAFAELLNRSVVGDTAAAERLSVSPSRVSQRLSERSLYAVPYGETRYFPTWQFDDKSSLRGLRALLTALDPSLHPLTVDHWVNAPNFELMVAGEPVTPVVWLRTGGMEDDVAELADQL